jgi:hypothetical protein
MKRNTNNGAETMTRNTDTTRVYPACCRSAYCGRLDCTGCRNKPILDEFKAWVAATGAVKSDPIWCPNVYTVTK